VTSQHVIYALTCTKLYAVLLKLTNLIKSIVTDGRTDCSTGTRYTAVSSRDKFKLKLQ